MNFRHLLILVTCITALAGCTSTKPLGRDLAMSSSEWASKAEFWVMSHQEPSGHLPYFFDPAVDGEVGKRHAFGELIAAHRIAQLASQRPRLAAVHSSQLTTLLSSANPSGDPSALAIDHNNAASLGVNALLLRLLLESSDSAYDASTHVQSIAEHLIEAWDESTGFPEYLDGRPTKSDYLRRYYTGIAALALIEHFEATQNESSLQVALEAVDWLENAYPAKDSKAFHPSPTPWLVEALSELNRLRPQQKLQERIFDLSDHFVALQDTALFPGRFWLPKGPNFGSPNTVPTLKRLVHF